MMMWVALLIALIPPVCGFIVWRKQKGEAGSSLLLACSMVFFLATIATVTSDYLPSSPDSWMTWLSTGQAQFIADISWLYYLACGTCIFFFFPQKLVGTESWPPRILTALTVYGCVSLLNNLDFNLSLEAQKLYLSRFEFYLPLPFFTVLIIYLFTMQWKASEVKPVERAQTLWMILSLLAAPGLLLLFYLLPLLSHSEPVVTLLAWLLAVVLMHLMFSVEIGQFESFKLEAFTSTLFSWTVFTLVFLNMGIVLISQFGLSEHISTIILFASVLWLYMPLRQWLEHRLVSDKHQQKMNSSIIRLVESSLIPTYAPKQAWYDILASLFSPLKIEPIEHAEIATVCHRGQGLRVPGNHYAKALKLEFAEEGQRLFTKKDIELVETSSLLFEQLFKQRDEYFSGQSQERDRIRRDLHDQIGHKLLSIIYSAKDQKSRSLAKNTMKQLRELISALNHDLITAEDAISKLKQLTEETCENCDLKILWHQNFNLSFQHKFRSNQYLNIANIVREILNNTIKHAGATQVTCTATSNSDALSLVISDNGTGFDLKNTNRGNGLFNIEARAAEIDANIHWSTNAGTQFTLDIPLRVMDQQQGQI